MRQLTELSAPDDRFDGRYPDYIPWEEGFTHPALVRVPGSFIYHLGWVVEVEGISEYANVFIGLDNHLVGPMWVKTHGPESMKNLSKAGCGASIFL